MILESKFKRDFIKVLKQLYPSCIILKNDASYLYGIPDMLILFGNKWAMLEFKRDPDANKQANQDYYIHLLNSMSYASFVNPENKEKVLDELQQTFRPSRSTRFSRGK